MGIKELDRAGGHHRERKLMEQIQEKANPLQRAEGSPAVSVVIPTYNSAAYIGEALRSVFAQTLKDYEVIVVNDGSPDTEELEGVLEPYRDRIFYLRQENRGVSGARNTAIRAARGRYIALLDPDDMFEPEYLAVQVAVLERDPTVDVVYPNALIIGDASDAGREFMELCPSEGEVTFESLVTERCTVNARATVRREAIIRAGMFDESCDLSEDFDLWLRVLKRGGRIVYHRQILARYRRRKGSISADASRMCRRVLRVLEKTEATMDLTAREAQAVKQARALFQCHLRFWQAKKAFLHGDIGAAIENLREMNALSKSAKITLVLFLLRIAPHLCLRAYRLRERLNYKMQTTP